MWSQSARHRGPISRAEAGSRRRSGAGPNDTAEARCFAASGSPGFACGAEARDAGPAFGSQQHPVDAGSCGWAVGHQWFVTRCRARHRRDESCGRGCGDESGLAVEKVTEALS